MFSGNEEQNDVSLCDSVLSSDVLIKKCLYVCVCASPQGNGGTGTPSAEEGLEDIVGGMYVRFDAPKAKIRKSWPGVRGTLRFNPVYSLLNYPLTLTDRFEI